MLHDTEAEIARLNQQSSQLYRQGQYQQALEVGSQLLDLIARYQGDDSPDFAACLNNMAFLHTDLGDYAAAEALYQQSIHIIETTLGDSHPDLARGLDNLASLYQEMGNHEAARNLIIRAARIRGREGGESHPDFANSLNRLGILYYEEGKYEDAAALLRQAIRAKVKALGDNHPDLALDFNNLAALYADIGDDDGAALYYGAAIRLLDQADSVHPLGLATTVNNLAQLYYRQGNYVAAEPLYRQVIANLRSVGGARQPYLSKALGNLAALCVARERPLEALELMEQAHGIDEHLISEVFSGFPDNFRLAFLETVQTNTAMLLSLVINHLPIKDGHRGLALDLLLRRKGIGAEALAAQRDAILTGRYSTLAPKLQELKALRLDIAQRALAGPGGEGTVAHQERLAQLNAQKDKLEAELARQMPELKLVVKLREADRRAVAQVLPSGSSLVEFVHFKVCDFKAVHSQGERVWKPAHYAAFVLAAGQPDDVRLIDLGEAEPIDRLIAEYRTATTGEEEDRGQRDLDAGATGADESRTLLGARLRAALFDPLREALGSHVRLFLAPDGDLARLPFEVLPLDGVRHLIDAYQISYLATGRDILRLNATPTRPPSEPLIAADPDFDLGDHSTVRASPRPRSRAVDRAGLRFVRLPGTRVEGERIAAMLGVQPWLDQRALEGRLKAVRSPRILHLATHGFFLENQPRDANQQQRGLGAVSSESDAAFGRLAGPALENPLLRSGLALAGANTWLTKGSLPNDAEDGLLTAEDVTGLDLLDTDLVVLSACETGIGEVRTGEGVFGLRRSFILAGAKTLVMSLWKVPDPATAILMEAFYENLLNHHLPRAEALRTAQFYVRDLRVGDIRGRWLTLAMIERWAADQPIVGQQLQNLAGQSDDYRPFTEPLYWGAFICQGESGPLVDSSVSGSDRDPKASQLEALQPSTREVPMSKCDICGVFTSVDEGTVYSAAEFRELIARGYGPDDQTIARITFGLRSREQFMPFWRQQAIASATPWLLCPRCAARAAEIQPPPQKIVPPVTASPAEPPRPVNVTTSASGTGPTRSMSDEDRTLKARYERELTTWQALPWWKRLTTKKPEPPRV